MPNPITPADLDRWEAICVDAKTRPLTIAFDIEARLAFPRLLAAYRELLEERRGVEYHDA